MNLKEQAQLGFSYLRPLQVAYESPKFMLPIRLGMVNADGPQELFVYALTRNGRVETTNYRTVRLPTDVEVPALREGRVRELLPRDVHGAGPAGTDERGVPRVRVGHGWCDPCAADPPSREELRGLGVFWLGGPTAAGRRARRRTSSSRGSTSATTAAHFPEDLVFQETGDQTNFQGRYVLRHPYAGPISCGAERLPARPSRPPREGGAHARLPHGMGHREDPQPHGARHRSAAAEVVREDLEPPERSRLGQLGGGSWERRSRFSLRSIARRMSSSKSSASGRPLASQSFGYIEIAVKPGRVFSSLTSTRSVPRSRKKSTRAMPEIPARRKALTARRADLVRDRVRDRRGDQELRLVVAVLVVVVVELAPRHDFADDRGPRLVVAEDGALQLPRVDAFLDEGAVVVAEGEVQSGVEVGPVLDLTDADRGAAVGRFDEERERESEVLGDESPPHPVPLADRRQPRRGSAWSGIPASRRRDLKTDLSMPMAEPVDAGADVGNPEELEEALEDRRPRRSCRG